MRRHWRQITLQAPRLFLAVVCLGLSSTAALSQGVGAASDSAIDLWKAVVAALVLGSISWVGLEIRGIQKAKLDQKDRERERDVELERRLGKLESRVERLMEHGRV